MAQILPTVTELTERQSRIPLHNLNVSGHQCDLFQGFGKKPSTKTNEKNAGRTIKYRSFVSIIF